MDINQLIKELNLVYYGYNEDEKAFISWIDTTEALHEFNNLVDKLKENSINHEVVNTGYIKIDI